jgi:hypothetical protein
MTGTSFWPPAGPDLATEADQAAEWAGPQQRAAHHDEIDRLQLAAQHEDALAENADREAGQ